jgi:hypothetical protein
MIMKIMKRTFALAAAVALVCLSSVGAMAANKLIVKGTDGTTDKFVVTDNGFIGVGMNTPAAGLNIVGSALSTSQIRSHFVGTNASGGGGLFFLHNNGTSAALTMPVTGNRLGYFYFGSFVGPLGAPTAIPLGAGVSVRAEANWTSTSAPAYMTFDTSGTGQALPVEKMRLTSTGNLGIGTTAPTQKLDVNGVAIRIAGSATAPLAAECTAATRGTLRFVQGTTDQFMICGQSGGTPIWRTITAP